MKLLKHTILFLSIALISSITYAFDYESYTKDFIESNKNEKVGQGSCYDFIQNLLTNVEDSLLINLSTNIYGEPRTPENSSVGDIVIVGNHIMIIYEVKNDSIFIADQNRIVNGVREDFVDISYLNKSLYDYKNFQIYHPVELNNIPTYKKLLSDGYEHKRSKEICLGLFSISVNDADKISCSNYKNYYIGKNTEYCQMFFIDSDYNYTDLEYEFFSIFKKNKTSVYHVVGEERTYRIADAWFIFTDDGIIVLDNIIEQYSEIYRPFLKIKKE